MEKKTKKDIMEELEEAKKEVASHKEDLSLILKELEEVVRILGKEEIEDNEEIE